MLKDGLPITSLHQRFVAPSARASFPERNQADDQAARFHAPAKSNEAGDEEPIPDPKVVAWACQYPYPSATTVPDKQMAFGNVIRFVLPFVASVGMCSAPASAQVAEDSGRQALTELRTLVSEGTAVIGDLQPTINSGKVPADQVAPEALVERFRARYQKASGNGLDTQAPGLVGELRRAYLESFRNVVVRYQGPLKKGGQDAFVPAYFRALVLKDFNAAMKGKVRAYASNREGDLINSDSSVQRVMKASPLVGEVDRLMASGSLDSVVKRSGDHLLGYWPMKLGASCVACHAQQGLKQTEGTFGGALVAEIAVK